MTVTGERGYGYGFVNLRGTENGLIFKGHSGMHSWITADLDGESISFF